MDNAAQDFADSARTAAQLGDSKLEGRSLYNLGTALAQKKDLNGAVQSYLGAIASAQRTQDAELEAAARRNIQLLIAERQKQKQQEQKDQKEKKGKEGKEGKPDPNGSQGEPKDDQKKQDKDQKGKNQQAKDEPRQYEDPSKSRQRQRQFKSGKLSKDDAERVMAELSNREKDLQGRLKRQTAMPQSQPNEKDW